MRKSVELTSYERTVSADLNDALMKARGLSGGWRVINDVVAWRVDKLGNYGFFWLQKCEDTPEYRAEVRGFFEEVADAEVENLVISVQQNGGGNSQVVYPLLGHSSARNVKAFSTDSRYSSEALAMLGATQAQFTEAVRKTNSGGMSKVTYIDRSHLPKPYRRKFLLSLAKSTLRLTPLHLVLL